jgi:hypothetical protein
MRSDSGIMRLIVSIDWIKPGNNIRVPGETTHPHLNHTNSEMLIIGMKLFAGDELLQLLARSSN